jgi:Tol biopolymer transport system component
VRYDTKTQGVVPYLSGIWAEGVSFSPNGKWVAYVKQPEGDLWRSKIDGGESLRLTFPPTVPSQPRWSPDGKRIAFVSPSPEGALKIHLISADGGSLEEPLPQGMQASLASWSSDGESLAFNYCCGPPVDRTGIHLLDLKTRQVSTLPGSEGLMHPRFSPDGRFITAEPLDLNGPLPLSDVNARKRSDLAGSELGWNAGGWSRDSRYVYMRTDTETGPIVNRVRISDGKVEQVANLEGLQLVDGTWMGLAPDDSPLFVRDVGSYELYALDWEAP